MSLFLLVTHGSDGDVLPFVAVGAALAGAGHRVVLLTHAPYRDAAVAAGLGFRAIDDESAFERTLADTPGLLGSDPGRLGWEAFYRRNGMFEQIARECAMLRELYRPGETVLVGRHTSGVSVRFVGELLGAPVAWLALAPTQVMAAPVAAHTYGTELVAGFTEVRAGLGLPAERDWRRWFDACDAVIGLWPRWFDEAGPRSPYWVRLTGFPLADTASRALGERAAVQDASGGSDAPPPGSVLATGGTGRMLHPRYYPALTEAAGLTGLPTTLVVRHRDLLPDRLPPNVRWQPGIRFADVLPQAAALVHHGGIGTCARALAAGCPQVVMADGIDRPDNAARLARRGLARAIPAEGWGPEELAEAIVAAAADEGYGERAAGAGHGERVAGVTVGDGTRDRACEVLVRGDGATATARIRDHRATGATLAEGGAVAAARQLAALTRPVADAVARLRTLSAPDRARLHARLRAARAAASPDGAAR
ncbi:glycosyltransferase [Streptomyces sp. NPDC052415]|uniref:glycosyltransferase n=1 Tax=Streptomyces sp. NPDC052415 TaxID=3365690 RepID=UPI0037D66177